MQRVADRAGAVIACVPPAAVAAAVDVGLGADLVGGLDHRADAGRGATSAGSASPLLSSWLSRAGCRYLIVGGREAAAAALGGGAAGSDRRRCRRRPRDNASPALSLCLLDANRSPSSAYGVSCRAGAERSLRPHLNRWVSPENVVPPLPRRPSARDSAFRLSRNGGSLDHRLGRLLIKHKHFPDGRSHFGSQIPVGITAGSLRAGMELAGRQRSSPAPPVVSAGRSPRRWPSAGPRWC